MLSGCLFVDLSALLLNKEEKQINSNLYACYDLFITDRKKKLFIEACTCSLCVY